MAVETPRINWRQPFDDLEPYLDGQGGVVVVRYTSAERCAPNAFVQTLTSEYEFSEASGRRVSIRLDPQDYNTRFLGGIRETLRRKLGFKVQVSGPPTAGSITIGSNNQSGGDLSLDVTVNQFGNDPAQARELSGWRDAFLTEMEGFLASGRRVMIILGEGPRGSHREFWRDLWNAGMDALARKGLCVVSMICDPDGQAIRNEPEAARPGLIIDLPGSYGAEETGHAIQDLTGIFAEHTSLCEAGAGGAARLLVLEHQQNVSALHSAVPGLLIKLARPA